MNLELISIIVPVYNVENYLFSCVESILNQTYENFELLLIDDGSSDSSPSICDDFAKKDCRIHVIHRENQGPSAARNYGIDASKGEFIVFIDSDDLVHPEMLEKMTYVMNRYQTELCISGYERFKDNWRKRSRISPYSLVIMQSQMELASVYTKPETNMFGISVWAKMYRADIIKNNNIRFRTDLDYEEDCCFNLDYFRHISTTGALRDYFYSYRQMDSSLSKGYRKDTFQFLVNGYQLRSAYLTELGMDTSLGKVDAIFLIVIKNTLIKIFQSDLTKEEKLEEYKKIVSFEECQKICCKLTKAKSRLTRLLTNAVANKNANKIHTLLTLWDMKGKIKNFCKKVRRN